MPDDFVSKQEIAALKGLIDGLSSKLRSEKENNAAFQARMLSLKLVGKQVEGDVRAGGWVIHSDGRGIVGSSSSSQSDAVFPFKVLFQQDPSTPGQWMLGVYNVSLLQNTRAYGDLATITGLLASPSPTPSDAGWIPMLSGATSGSPDHVWLKVTGSPTGQSAWEIESVGNGDTYDGGEVEYAGSPAAQTFARITICTAWFLTNSPDSSPQLRQYLNKNLTILPSSETAKDNTGMNPLVIPAFYFE